MKLCNVTFNYDPCEEGSFSISDFSLGLPDSSVTAIVGPSGSGKSTLLQLTTGNLRPSSGVVQWDDQDIWSMSEKRRLELKRRYIGQIFQDFHMLPTLTLRENIELTLYLARLPELLDAIDQLADRFGVSGVLDRYPAEVSGGQQQRCAVMRALITTPRLIVADEATSNLDLVTSLEVLEALRAASTYSQCAVLISTHDPYLAAQADEIIVIRDGQVFARLHSASAQTISNEIVRAAES